MFYIFSNNGVLLNWKLIKKCKNGEMRKTIPAILFLLLQLYAWGQTETDNLINKLEHMGGKEKIDSLIKISLAYNDSSDYKTAIGFAEQALKLSEHIDYKKGIIDAENVLGVSELRSSQLEEGLKYTRKAVKLAKEENYERGLGSAYRNIGLYLVYTGNRVNAMDTLQMSLDIFERLGDSTNYATTLLVKGMAHAYAGETNEAITTYEDAIKYFGEADSFRCAVVYLNLSTIHSGITGNNELALKYALIALNEFEKIKHPTYLAYCLSNIGIIYDNMEDYDKSIETYKRGLDIVKDSGNQLLITNFLNNLGEDYKKKREYDTAREYYQRSYELNNKIGYAEGIAVTLNNLGECDYYNGDYQAALDKFEKSYMMLENMGEKIKLPNSLNNIASAHFKLGNYAQAGIEAEKAVKLGSEVDATLDIQNGYYTLYLVSDKKNDYHKALNYYIKYETIKDSLTSTNLNDKVAELRNRYEAEQKEKQIALLTQEQKLSDAELAKQETLTYLLFIIIVLAAVIAYILYKKSRERKVINEELKELNHTKDSFFSIIAHDLKGPFNSLLGISEILAEDAEEFTTEEIKKISVELNDNAKNTYMLLENLLQWASNQTGKAAFYPEIIDLNEILSRNVNLYQSMAHNKKINLIIDISGSYMIKADKNMVDTIVRNLLNNAIKFTRENGEVKVYTKFTNDKVSFFVEDNGIGMDEKSISKLFRINERVKSRGTNNEQGTGLGLILTKEFLDKNNGSIEVISEVNKGTTFKVTFQRNNQQF